MRFQKNAKKDSRKSILSTVILKKNRCGLVAIVIFLKTASEN
jgi:hypothetical protein